MQERRELGRCLHHLLEVVEEAEHRLVGDVLGEAVLRAERLRRGREDERRVAQRRERDPPHAVGVGVGGEAGRLQREPRLAGAARPGQGEEARVVCARSVDDLGELLLAAEEGCRWHRQVRAVQALERGEVGLSELVDALGSDEVLEPVLAEVSQLVLDELRSRGRDEHLPAVTRPRRCGRHGARLRRRSPPR